jgi:hypothetical protein
MLLNSTTFPTCVIAFSTLDLENTPQSVRIYWYPWDGWTADVGINHLTGVPCDLRQPTDKFDDLRALLFRDGLMFALYMSLKIGRIDGKLASLAYDYLVCWIMYK